VQQIQEQAVFTQVAVVVVFILILAAQLREVAVQAAVVQVDYKEQPQLLEL
jgi:hypothetical protein